MEIFESFAAKSTGDRIVIDDEDAGFLAPQEFRLGDVLLLKQDTSASASPGVN
jgi:hypothetical protein